MNKVLLGSALLGSLILLSGCGDEGPNIPSQSVNILRECGTRYHQDKHAGTLDNKTWNQYLAECKLSFETPLQSTKPVEPPKPPEKWTNGDEYDERLPRNIKFQLGDVVCLKNHKKTPMVVWDIAPKLNKDGTAYASTFFKYYTHRFDKNDNQVENSYYEYELVKCGEDQ